MRHSTTIGVRLQALQTQSQASNSCCAPLLPRQFGMEEAGLVPVGQSSLKAALDHAWGEPTARERTLRVVLEEVERWKSWREQQQRLATQAPSLQEMMGTLGQRVAQDTEPDPEGEPGGRHITKWMERANSPFAIEKLPTFNLWEVL